MVIREKEYIKLKDKPRSELTEHDIQDMIDHNKELVRVFPFLLPYNAFTDLVDNDYDYTYTMLDEMPNGWRLAFGMKLCWDIKNELKEAQHNDPDGGYVDLIADEVTPYLQGYRVRIIKEKFGELRWYDNGLPNTEKNIPIDIMVPDDGVATLTANGDTHYDIINKYTILSRNTCIECGEPAEYESKGWISPYCEKCANKMYTDRVTHEREHYPDDEQTTFEDMFEKIIKEEK